MAESRDSLMVHVNIDIAAEILQTVVQNSKITGGQNERGHANIDPADKLSELISKFLVEKDFDSFVRNLNNYS